MNRAVVLCILLTSFICDDITPDLCTAELRGVTVYAGKPIFGVVVTNEFDRECCFEMAGCVGQSQIDGNWALDVKNDTHIIKKQECSILLSKPGFRSEVLSYVLDQNDKYCTEGYDFGEIFLEPDPDYIPEGACTYTDIDYCEELKGEDCAAENQEFTAGESCPESADDG